MRLRSLPQTNLAVTNLCLDTSAFGQSTDARTVHAILDGFCARGGNFIQADASANAMAYALTDALVGEWLRARAVEREELVIASRVVLPKRDGVRGSLAGHLSDELDEVLRRLRVDYLDLLLCAMPDLRLSPGELLVAMSRLVAAGRVRHAGVCGFQGWRIRDAVTLASAGRIPRLEAVQANYSAYQSEVFERDLFLACRAGDIGFVARPESAAHACYRANWRSADRQYSVHRALQRTAAVRGESIEQTETAWILGHPHVASVVVRVNSPDELVPLCAAASAPLSANERAQISSAPALGLDDPYIADPVSLSLELESNGRRYHG